MLAREYYTTCKVNTQFKIKCGVINRLENNEIISQPVKYHTGKPIISNIKKDGVYKV